MDLLLELVPEPRRTILLSDVVKQKMINDGLAEQYFGGGDFSVYMPESAQSRVARQVKDGKNKTVTSYLDGVLHDNPGSVEALRGLIEMQDRGYVSPHTRVIMSKQVKEKAFTDEGALLVIKYFDGLAK